ncbi:MAG: chitobiase/beta-hexosaminidase C-terminal domain-containing protein [Bacteroidales bacterium]|nr:chitobiase/beta-hexosaminidase C-terminal domain-containing protein [Bacteroidales bacterium]
MGAASFNEGLASDTVYLGSFGSPWSGNSGNNSGSSTGSQTGGNSGSGNETPNVTAPVISGTTPFADTTQVTLTEPEGARAYYTTDGSTPTAESTLYTEPFNLSATTTVKAIAIKDETASEVASKTFTKSSGGSDTE